VSVEADIIVEGRDRIIRFLQTHPRPLPSDELVTIEDAGGIVVVNAPFGSKANMALGHFLATMLAAKSGASVSKQVDPSRVLIRTNMRRAAHEVERLITETDPEALDTIIRKSLLNSNEVRWHLFQVARKFGAVRRDADISRFGTTVIQRYRGTVLFEEAMESYLWDRMDIERAADVLRAVQSKDTGIEMTALSPIGRSGMDRYGDLMRPFRSDRAILRALENRLRAQRMAMVCMSCRTVFHGMAEKERTYECTRCGSRMIAAMRPWKAEKKDIRDAFTSKAKARPLLLSANLVREHDDMALMALAARGVGPKTAARLLRLYGHDELELLRGILQAEVTFARTHRFWD